MSVCDASSAIQDKQVIPLPLRRLLDRPDGYKSLEDAAIQRARYRDPVTKLVRPGGLASEAVARADLKRVYDAMVNRHGKATAAQKFFRRTVGVVPCGYPCSVEVTFPTPQSLSIECAIGTDFKPGMSVPQVQAEVARVANLLGIKVPPMPSVLTSNCPPRKGKSQANQQRERQQAVTLTAAQRVAQDIIANILFKEMTKGALLWHSVGAGKTCAAVAAASVMIQQGWRVKWFSVAQLKNQPLIDAFFTRRCHSLPIPNDVPEAQRLGIIGKYIEIQSFSTLGHAFERPVKNDKAQKWLAEARRKYRDEDYKGSDPLYKTLIVFDEPHKISQVKTAQERMKWDVVTAALRKSYQSSGENSARLLMLDATPMVDGPKYLFTMLNALHVRDILPKTDEAARAQDLVSVNGVLTAKGREAVSKAGNAVISYVNLAADRSRFAYAKKWSFNPVAMSEKQVKKMRTECAKRKSPETKRACAEKTAVSVDMPRSRSIQELQARAPQSYPLLTQLVKVIQEQDADDRKNKGNMFKHVIFTNVRDITHAKNIADVLKVNGYTLVDPGKAAPSNGKGVLLLSGTGMTGERKAKVLDMFNNHEDNARGEKARFLIVDGRFREGINLFDVRHFHMLQPLTDFEERQAVGRVLRMCGSTFLPASDNIWQVRLHLYDAVDVSKDEASIYDLLNVRESEALSATMEQLETLCMDIALDKRLFQQYNVVNQDKDYEFKRDVATAHLCDGKDSQSPVDGKCPPGYSKVVNRYGVECCVRACRVRGKDLPLPDSEGKCPKGYVRGQSASDPNSDCCYSKGSKRGKDILAGRVSPPSPPKSVPMSVPEVPPKAMNVPDSVAVAAAREELDMDDVEDLADTMDMDVDLLADEMAAMMTSARSPPKSPAKKGKRKQPCPGRLGAVRADGSCPPGNVAVDSPTVAGQKCCKWGCGRFKAFNGKCQRGYKRHVTASGAECCKKR